MGQLAFTIAGTAIGAFFGQPGLGAAIGGAIGGAAFPEEGPTVETEGPRLSTLRISSSNYGTPIPWVFGTQRVGVQLVWATNIVETRTETSTTSGGGKGGGGGGATQIHATYTYQANGALLCARGEKDIVKIWADSKVILEVESEGQIISAEYTDSITLYRGTTTQEPDPTIQADLGVEDTSAFRDFCYFVVNDFELANFGNRIPLFNALVTDGTPTITFAQLDIAAAPFSPAFSGSGTLSGGQFSPDGRYFFTPNGFVIDVLTRRVVTFTESTIDELSLVGGINDVDSNGNMLQVEGATTSFIYALDPLTWQPLYSTGPITGTPIFTHLAVSKSPFPMVAGDPIRDRVAVMGFQCEVWIFETVPSADPVQVTTGGGITLPKMAQVHKLDLHDFFQPNTALFWNVLSDGGAVADRDGKIWFSVTDGETDGFQEMWLFRLDVWTGAFEYGIQVPIRGTANGIEGGEIAYDPVTHKLAIRTFYLNEGPINNNFIECYDIDARTFNDDPPATNWHSTNGTNFNGKVSPNGSVWFKQTTATNIAEFKFADCSLTPIDISDWLGPTTNVAVQYDRLQDAIMIMTAGTEPTIYWLFLNRRTRTGVTLQFVINEISEEVGLSLADLDTDALTDTVKGYAINARMSARAAIEVLRGVYFFDATESDYKMKFVKKGADPIRTLTDDDLGASNDRTKASPLLQETRNQEVELPLRIDFQYSDENFDYQQGSQYSKRVDEAVITLEEVRVDVAVVFNATEAKNISEVMLFEPWVSRQAFFISATWQQLALDATDVILVNLDDGTSLQIYLRDVDISVEGIIEFGGVLQRPEVHIFRQTTRGAEAEGFDPTEIIVVSGSQFFIMDVPLLQDADEGAVSILHTAAGRVGDAAPGAAPVAWKGCQIERSFDNAIFIPWTFHNSASECSHGTVALALPSTNAPWVWDRVNTINVSMAFGALSSVTETQVLNGANAALVGNEIIQFATATLEADGSYTLSTLLRARRGTDLWARINNGVPHGIYERFVLLNEDTIQIRTHATENLGLQQTFRALTVGSPGGATKVRTPLGHSKFPYAPYLVDVTVDGSGNRTVTWTRRTRVGGAVDWKAGPAEPPLSEAFEQYNIVVLDPTNSNAEIRSITIDDAETGIYTVAQFEEDFGSELDAINDEVPIVVHQISDIVGRGFPSEIVTA